MNNFNYFQEALDKGITVSNRRERPVFTILALKGDLEKQHVYASGESSERTSATVIIYNYATDSLSEKSIYKNTKGYYFTVGTYGKRTWYLHQLKDIKV